MSSQDSRKDSTTSSLLEFIENSQLSTKFSAIKEDIPNQFLTVEERGKLIKNVIKDSADEVIRDDIDEAIDLGADDVDHEFDDENLFQNGAVINAEGQNGEDDHNVSLNEILEDHNNTEFFNNEFEPLDENRLEVDVLVHDDDEVADTLENNSEAENDLTEIEIKDQIIVPDENGDSNDEIDETNTHTFPIPKPRANQEQPVVSDENTNIESEGNEIEIENKIGSQEADEVESDDEFTENDTTLEEEIVEKVDQGTGENNHIDPLFGVASPAANETIGKAHALKTYRTSSLPAVF